MMNRKKLDKLWENATLPDLEAFDGKYQVDIVSGLGYLPARFVRSWTKTIIPKIHSLWMDGHNTINGNKTGYFTIFRTPGDTCVELFYDIKSNSNSKLWRRLKDHVRQVDEKTLIGKIYLKVWGKYRFVGYFTLERKTLKL